MTDNKPGIFPALGRLEPLLLFALLFLPGYASQFVSTPDGSLFNDPVYLTFYLMTAIPQFFLVFYLIGKDEVIPPEIYGIRAPEPKDFLLLPFSVAGVFLVLLPVQFLIYALSLMGIPELLETMSWSFSNYSLWPLVLLVCLTTGYLEEIYFRSYLCTRLEVRGHSRMTIHITVNVLFAAGHLYQGIPALVIIFAVGAWMSRLFFRHRSLHLIAMTHGLYNFTVLMISTLV